MRRSAESELHAPEGETQGFMKIAVDAETSAEC